MCRYLNLRPKKPENTQLFDESFFIFHKQKKYTIIVLINLYINSLTHKQYQNTIKHLLRSHYLKKRKILILKQEIKPNKYLQRLLFNLKLQVCTQWVVSAPSWRDTGELVSSGRNLRKIKTIVRSVEITGRWSQGGQAGPSR